MVMRGIFTLRRSELLFFYQDGSNHLFPDMFEPYANFIPKEERHDLMAAYHKRLIGDDEEVRLQAAKLWSRWEVGTSRLYIEEEQLARVEDAKVRARWTRNSHSNIADSRDSFALTIVCSSFCED